MQVHVESECAVCPLHRADGAGVRVLDAREPELTLGSPLERAAELANERARDLRAQHPVVAEQGDDVVLEEVQRPRRVPIDARRIVPAKLRGDRHNLVQLVRNLLDNAARYATSHVTVTTRLEPHRTVLCVDDDGPGIPEPERERVFERFTRGSSDRSRQSGGAGLGLAVVRRIAEQHGGSVSATESPAGGARLEVVFPTLNLGLTP